MVASIKKPCIRLFSKTGGILSEIEIFRQLTNFSLHLGSEPAAESNGMAQFDDWFVASGVKD
jgi:hypothetical protein